MLQFAIATLLALQAASGSPNPAPPGTSPQSSAPQGVVPSTGAAPRRRAAPRPRAPTRPPRRSPPRRPRPAAPRRTTPTPGPRPSPTPAVKAGGDMLLVVNKTDGTVSILDAATGKLRATVAVEAGPHEVEVLADGKTAAVSSYGTKAEPGRHGDRRRPDQRQGRLPHRHRSRLAAARAEGAARRTSARHRRGHARDRRRRPPARRRSRPASRPAATSRTW